MHRPKTILIVTGLAVASASGVFAQTNAPNASAEAEPSLLLQEVALVGSKGAALALPASGAFIDVQELRKHNYSDVNRVLRQVPGVYVREEDGYGLFPNISLRGVTTERSKSVTLMEDGILAAPAPYSAPSAYYSPNVARMSGLEILKGSSQIKYGPHITGGAINYLSTPIPNDLQTYLKVSYGSYNEVITHFWNGHSVETENAGRVGYLVETFMQRTDGFKTIDAQPGFTATDKTGFTRVEPMVKVFWELPLEAYHRIELKYGFSQLDAEETYLGLNDADFRADSTRRYSASRFDNIETRNHRASIRHTMELSDALRINTTGYYQFFKRNWFKLNDLRGPNVDLSTALLDTSAGGGLAVLRGEAAGTLRVRANAREYYMYGVQSVATVDFDLGETEHNLEAGVRYHFDEVDRFQQDTTYTQAANGAITGVAVGAPGAAGDRIQQSHAVALHLLDEIQWRKFTLTPGMRFEMVDQYYEQDKRRADGGGTPADGEGQVNAAAGGLTLAYDIRPAWKTFVGVHRGFSIPEPRAAIRATPNLEEETSLGVEVGTRYHRDADGLLGELVLFRTDFDDLIVGGNLGGGGAATTENVGNIDTMGAEIQLGYDLGRAQDWAVRTPTRLSVTLTDAKLDGNSRNTDPESLFEGGRDGSKVPYVPEYQINGEVGLEYRKAGLYASMTYVPQTYTTASNSRDPIRSNGAGGEVADIRVGKTDNFFLLDLTVRYEFREGMSLLGGVKNLLNREYIATRHPYGPRTGLPRFFHVGLELLF